MRNWKGYSALAFLLVGIILFASCRKETFTSSPDAKLSFSTDSVIFDTVFTTVGSTTQMLTVYNRDKKNGVKVNLNLQNGSNSHYQINVDGVSGTDFSDVEIGPNDSIFVFVTVTVNPNQDQLYPFVEDRLEFNTNGNHQEVKLVAWGWNAVFYYPDQYPTNGLPPYHIISQNNHASVTWTADKPIVIYGYVVVDSTQSLTIEAGTQIFFHANSGLWIYRDGHLAVNGTRENPVVFQGDRLEASYQDIPGQWDRIWINEGSTDNVIKNAVIKNNYIGIQCETLPFQYNINAPNSSNTLVLQNVKIKNQDFAGIYSRNYRIKADNCAITAAGAYSFLVSGGGEYNLNHCTIANNYKSGIRNTPALFVTNDYVLPDSTLMVRQITNSVISNTIISGFNPTEFQLQLDEQQAPQQLLFDYCIIRSDTLHTVPSQFGTVYVSGTPGFKDLSGGDITLTDGAYAIGKGSATFGGLDTDLAGNPYANPPAIGCYEYAP